MAKTTKEFLKNNLTALASQVGGQDKLLQLPTDTVIAIAAHFDDSIAITIEKWLIEIVDMNIALGYEVYDKDYELLYNEDESLGLSDSIWGTTERDILLLWTLEFGQYVYLCYKTLDNIERVIILIKF